jgi:hypothetical protein
MGVTSFWFGMSCISTTVIIPLYIRHFTDSPLVIGLVPTILTAGSLLPQLFTANLWIARSGRSSSGPPSGSSSSAALLAGG